MLVAEGLHARPVIHAAPVGPVRILVVDDHEVLRSGLRWLLTRVGWVAGCAVAASGDAGARARGRGRVRRRARRRRPRRRVRARGLRAARCARADHGLLASRWDLVSLRTARGVGARGVIAKDQPARALLAAVHELAAGGACELPPARPARCASCRASARSCGSSAPGLTNAEIGAALFLAPGTIKHHMLGLYEKLGAPNRAAAVHAARRLGVLADHRVEEPVGAPGGARRRVLVADPDDLRRTGLLLALHGGVGARDADDALAVAARLRPEVALAGDEELAARCGRRACRRCWCATTRWRARAGAAAWCASGGRPSGSRRPCAPPRPRRAHAARGTTASRAPARGAARRRLPARARRPLRAGRRRHQPRDRAARSGCRPTPSSSTPPRSSASSGRATGPRPSASRTTSA